MNFVEFIIKCIENGYLQNDNFLICDSATIHHATDSIPMVWEILRVANIGLVFLPTYSPELNPCELVFGAVKKHLRENRQRDLPLEVDIAIPFHTVTAASIHNYYNKCLFP